MFMILILKNLFYTYLGMISAHLWSQKYVDILKQWVLFSPLIWKVPLPPSPLHTGSRRNVSAPQAAEKKHGQ